MSISSYVKSLLFVVIFSVSATTPVWHAVTYEPSPGRFGDKLLSYIHAKWIWYRYKDHFPAGQLQFLYKPFEYSDALMLHEKELQYHIKTSHFKRVVKVTKESVMQNVPTEPTLYVVPYFPESAHERKHCINFEGKPWEYFDVDWNNEEFIALLGSLIAPRTHPTALPLPADRVTVAVHLRRGGNHDDAGTIAAFPLKFLPIDFYVTQIKKIAEMMGHAPLYVYFFTDDNNPVHLMRMFQEKLQGYDIVFDCRRGENSDTCNVVTDFFAMKQFDCLIHSESNYSFIMSRLNHYLISLFPDSFYRRGKTIVYDHINVRVHKKHKKFTCTNF